MVNLFLECLIYMHLLYRNQKEEENGEMKLQKSVPSKIALMISVFKRL